MFKFDDRCDGCRDTGTDGKDVFVRRKLVKNVL